MSVVPDSTVTLRGRDFLSVADFSAAEVERVFGTADALKSEFRATRRHAAPALTGRTLAMLFQKPSACGRASRSRRGWRSSAVRRSTSPRTPSWARGRRSATWPATSSASSTASSRAPAPTRSSLELAAQAGIPVINGLTLREHPCQALADVFTIRERLGRLEGAVVTFVGDGNNVYHSLALLGAAFGMEVRLAHPAGYSPERADRRTGEGAGGGLRRAARLRERPVRARQGRRCRLHRRLDLDGPGGRGGGASRRLCRVSRRRRTDGRRRPGRGRDALPAGPSRRGDHLVRDGRAAEPDPRAVGEPPARPEGAAGRVAGDRHERRAVRAIQGRPAPRARRRRCAAVRRGPRRVRRGGRLAPTGRCHWSGIGQVLAGLGQAPRGHGRLRRGARAGADRRDRVARSGRRPGRDRRPSRARPRRSTGWRPRSMRTAGIADALDAARARSTRRIAQPTRRGAGDGRPPRNPDSRDPASRGPVARSRVLEDRVMGRGHKAAPAATDGGSEGDAATAEPEPPAEPEPADRPEPAAPTPPFDSADAMAAVEEAADRRRRATARARAGGASGHRAAGQLHAAIDVCYQALATSPADPGLHLALAELYLDRGWRRRPPRSSLLLARLAELGDDADTRERLCASSPRGFPTTPLASRSAPDRGRSPDDRVGAGRDATLGGRCRSS